MNDYCRYVLAMTALALFVAAVLRPASESWPAHVGVVVLALTVLVSVTRASWKEAQR